MGTSYHYANLTKREWFCVGTFGGSTKANSLCHPLASRCFALLLAQAHPDPNARSAPANGPLKIGRWAGDAIAVLGDEGEHWSDYHESFIDVEADAIVFMAGFRDGPESILAAAEEDCCLMRQLFHMVATKQASRPLEHALQQRFGDGFWHKHAVLFAESPWPPPKDLALPRTAGFHDSAGPTAFTIASPEGSIPC